MCCGAVNGQVVERRASFGFSFDTLLGSYDYSTDAFVSADGRRMAGTFSRLPGRLVAWLRIGLSETWLPRPDPALEEIVYARAGRYGLVLSDDPVPGNDFSGQQVYQFGTSYEFVYGDLGAFWTGEMTWSAGDQTLIVGAVPETAPGLPVTLRLRYDGTALASVEATMASGLRYHFRAMLSQP